ncbi:regulatory protein RecX [Rhodohalobacter sp. 614A]|uniref:regulatory protein RecX n=1 Tax=Rhodohalobacter sp. 614A TaxID=2908649 RepID=UPI001F301F6E|nr:regulatory protein RecX [Rhodohalobacter sp. 614A]
MNKIERASENADSDSIERKLPLPVTKITVQKKNQDRYSLFHDKLFLIGISRKTRNDFSIEEGVELTPSLYRQLNDAEDLVAIRDACFRYLSRRDHSSFELKQKVGKKGFKTSDIEQVIQNLSDSGYLDDETFAAKFVEEKTELNQWGPKKIKSHLYKKGIDRKIIDKVLTHKTDDLQLQQICVDLVMKRKRHFLRENDDYKRKQKIYRYLAGRGFSGSVIKKSLPRITEKLHA